MVPKWFQNGPKIVPKLSQNREVGREAEREGGREAGQVDTTASGDYFLTFWIILFILIDLKHIENNFIELLCSQGFQKGIICRGLNKKSENQQKAVGTKH